jgi:hypothetical protein
MEEACGTIWRLQLGWRKRERLRREQSGLTSRAGKEIQLGWRIGRKAKKSRCHGNSIAAKERAELKNRLSNSNTATTDIAQKSRL